MVDNLGGTNSQREGQKFNFSAAEAEELDGGEAMTTMKLEQERLLPIANVGRIMKQILPRNAKISKEAKETMQECVSEFISFVTGEASDKCHKEKRKTVNGDDVCWALSSLGFDDYADPLKRFLNRYREMEGEKERSAAAASASANHDGDEAVAPRRSAAAAAAAAADVSWNNNFPAVSGGRPGNNTTNSNTNTSSFNYSNRF